MCEEAAIYRLNAVENQHRADGLERLYREVSVEANRLRNRVRDLEDAILRHHDATWKRTREEDERLYDQLGQIWT